MDRPSIAKCEEHAVLSPTDRRRPRILAIGGTTRPGSYPSTLAIAVDEARRLDADVSEWIGHDLVLPLFNPESADQEARGQRLRQAVRACDGVLVASASYHGGIPGVLKNAFDYIDGADPQRPYLSGRAVGIIACAGGWQASAATLAALRTMTHALRAWPTPLGITINSSEVFASDGSCSDKDLDARLRAVARDVIEFAIARQLAGTVLASHQAA